MTDPIFMLGEVRGPAFEVGTADSLRSVDAVQEAYSRNRCARWVIADHAALRLLTKAVQAHDTWHRVLFLERATTARRELLHALFRVVVAPEDGVRLLPRPELQEALTDPGAEDLFIGGVANVDDKVVVLYRGNLDRLVVPFDWFRASPRGPRPDFAQFSVVDGGQTIRLGEYEAAADAILFDFDPQARRRMRDKEVRQDSSFGGALRRLRLTRGLQRSDFAPLSAKTIARIERGEVEEPHDDTLATIAKRLGVKAEMIKTY